MYFIVLTYHVLLWTHVIEAGNLIVIGLDVISLIVCFTLNENRRLRL